MSALERQKNILIRIGRCPGVSMPQLADEFGVTTRTIQRDISDLSLTEPIYATRGRYGGLFLMDNYHADWNPVQVDLVTKLLDSANHKICTLTDKEYDIVHNLILRHSIPKVH